MPFVDRSVQTTYIRSVGYLLGRPCMPWEKSFDMDVVLDRAIDVFWEKGYAATSLADLLKATGINKGSLYNAFGSKKGLFIKALLRYYRERRKLGLTELAAMDNPKKAIEVLFDGLVTQNLANNDNKGCLLVNTALDLPNHDPDIEQAVKKGLADVEAFFVKQLTLAKSRNEVSKDLDVNRTAKGLLTLVVGLQVLARGVFDEEGLTSIRDQAVDLIS